MSGRADGQGRGRRRRRIAGAVVAMLLVAAGILGSAPALASVAEEPDDAGQSGVRVLPGRLPVPSTNTDIRAMWLWPEGRRAFQLVERQLRPTVLDSGVGGGTDPTYDVVAHDLDSLSEVGRAPVNPTIALGAPSNYGGGQDFIGTVDQGTGRLFVSYLTGKTATNTLTKESVGRMAGAVAQGEEVCLPAGTAPGYCIGGVAIIDGQTLQTTGTIGLRSISVDGAPVRPQVRAVEYAPPRFPGDKEKLYLLLEESVGSNGTEFEPRMQNASMLYVVQLDVESGQQEWAVRVDACRAARESQQFATMHSRPHPAAVFRSMSMEDPAVWVGCHTGKSVGVVARLPLDANSQAANLPVAPAVPSAEDEPSAESAPVSTAGGQDVFPGPQGAVEIMADPVSNRLLMKVISGEPSAEVWWVFDGNRREYIGTIGIGQYTINDPASTAGLDRERGRLYVFGPRLSNGSGGLFMSDIRRTPLSQALVFPELADLATWESKDNGQNRIPIKVDPGKEGRAPRLYWRFSLHDQWTVLEDTVPSTTDILEEKSNGRTLDLDELEGITGAAWDGAARGYGARMLMVGGVEAATRFSSADPTVYRSFVGPRNPVTDAEGSGLKNPVTDQTNRIYNKCGDLDREIVLASVGGGNPAVVDVTGGRGTARPLSLDSTTAADSEAPASRCSPLDWEEVWTTALFGRPPADEPRTPSAALFGKDEASCLSSDQAPQAGTGGGLLTGSSGDPVGSPFAAHVECSPDEVAGWSQARVTQIGDFALTNVYSSFHLYRDPARGIVSRVESVARGVSAPGVFRIDSIRSVAESWANGRKQPVAASERDPSYDPNCDMDRTAGTCFRRHVMGVWTPGYQCGPCGDETRLETALNKAVGAYARVRLRQPDPVMAKGAENGFMAAVQKPDHERFADLVLNNDLLQTVVPGLEIVRYADPGVQPLSVKGRKGRQVYQFAGVEVSSSYGISCLLVYDEAANTCAEAAEPPGAIQVSLSDSDGKPLAGGAFEVRLDVDADGVLGLKDTLLANGACVTADDGVGTCMFDALQPGSYLVGQVAAPPGYAKSAEPFVVELASGEQRTVAFTNVSNVSTIDLKATDENGAPLSGAVFAAYPDPDSDGKVAPEAKPAAECTTDGQGACQMKVPAGSYVLVQTSAPGGLEGIEPVAFTFASGGQVASVSVVNYPPNAPEAPEAPASPIYTPPVDVAPPTEIVDDSYVAPSSPVDTVAPPRVSVPRQIAGTVTQVIRAPGDALRLLARDPKQAVAWTAALALFVLAAMAVRRRNQAITLIGK